MRNKLYKRYIAAFSLTELSVVILIISLIIGAVSGGIRILKSSEIKRFVSDIRTFQVAIENFQSKYEEFPGDIGDASKYWGEETEDGNSNGYIEYSEGGENEALRAWQHIVLSGFLEGSYTGVSTNGNQADISINTPISGRSGVGYMLSAEDFGDIGYQRNNLIIGGFLSGKPLNSGALTSKEALSMDKKYDDGSPSSGNILSENADNNSGCISSEGSAKIYNVKDNDDNTLSCRLSFPILP